MKTENILPALLALGLDDLYAQPFRKYHTAVHLNTIFRTASDMGVALSPAQEKAILFHDAFYIPGHYDNESNSASMAAGVLASLAYGAGFITKVVYLVGITKGHEAFCTEGKELCDLDKAMLGSEPEQYLRNSSNIMREALEFQKDQVDLITLGNFLEKRMEWIATQLDKKALFNLPQFVQKFQAQAVINLEQEGNAIHENTPRPKAPGMPVTPEQVEECVREIYMNLYDIDVSDYIGSGEITEAVLVE